MLNLNNLLDIFMNLKSYDESFYVFDIDSFLCIIKSYYGEKKLKQFFLIGLLKNKTNYANSIVQAFKNNTSLNFYNRVMKCIEDYENNKMELQLLLAYNVLYDTILEFPQTIQNEFDLFYNELGDHYNKCQECKNKCELFFEKFKTIVFIKSIGLCLKLN